MARIAGVNIPSAKRVVIALTYIHGIGNAKAQEIIEKADIDVTRRVADLSELEVSRLREIIDADYTVEGDLRREVSMNVKRLMDLGCYRGLRHRRNMPVRGQRSRRQWPQRPPDVRRSSCRMQMCVFRFQGSRRRLPFTGAGIPPQLNPAAVQFFGVLVPQAGNGGGKLDNVGVAGETALGRGFAHTAIHESLHDQDDCRRSLVRCCLVGAEPISNGECPSLRCRLGRRV